MRVSCALRAIVGLALLAAVGSARAETPAAAAAIDDAAKPGPCEPAIAVAERVRGIPFHLLRAIAMVESGRYSKTHNGHIAWPWTVMAEGRGRYLPSKQAAISEVKALRERGVSNIDVGCMQVNLHYHGHNFSSLEEAFDPVHNVAYATTFLMDLRTKRNSWVRAVKEYHSTDRQRQKIYQDKVMASWNALKKGKLNTATLPGQPTGAEALYGGYLRMTNWPPRNYAAQLRAESAARSRVMSGASQ